MRKEIDFNGTIRYYNNQGQFHNENGPAIEYIDGTKSWYVNGVRHRDDGPARVSWTGAKFWYKNGKLHREDGPAIEYANGSNQYWYEGFHIEECYSDEYLNKWIKLRAFR
jgi:hypothetical protein